MRRGGTGDEYKPEDEDQLLDRFADWASQQRYEELNAYLESHPDIPEQVRLAVRGMVLLSNFTIRSQCPAKKG